MSLNVQYMILFKNSRDQIQIQTLAHQMFPIDWRPFLQHYKAMTNEENGHVILDLHPSISNDRLIVTDLSQQLKHQVPDTRHQIRFVVVETSRVQSGICGF